MIDDHVRWTIVKFPQRVADDERPWSKYFIADDGVVVAEIIDGGSEAAFQMVKRLNQWEEEERERWKREIGYSRGPVGAEGPTGG